MNLSDFHLLLLKDSTFSESLKLNSHFQFQKENKKISAVSDEISKVKKNSIFIAIQGKKFDGNLWIKSALKKGALLVIAESKVKRRKSFKNQFSKKQFAQIFFVKDIREAFSKISSNFYNHPSSELFCIGITGTNGKTTTAYMIEEIFSNFSKVGLIGTIDHHIKNEKTWKTKLTTPKSSELQKRLSDFLKRNVKVSIMEVSSHAILQKRAHSISFNALLFTNFSSDHLDYHKSLKNYFLAKEKLFNLPSLLSSFKLFHRFKPYFSEKKGSPLFSTLKPFAVINRDNPWIKKLKTKKELKVWTYGKQKNNRISKNIKNDFSFKILKMDLNGTKVEIKNQRGEKKEVQFPFFGEHNIYNATSAIAVAVQAQIPFQKALKALKNFPGVPGRLERIKNKKGIHVFVDYAHNESGLSTILKSIQEIKKRNKRKFKVISLFGCGGNRDKQKRVPMAKTALRYSDQVFLTSDNPRNENPKKIIKDSLKGIDLNKMKGRLFTEVSRKKAIFNALKNSKKGDVVLIFGKGHENFQITKKGKLPFSDRKVVQSFFSSIVITLKSSSVFSLLHSLNLF